MDLERLLKRREKVSRALCGVSASCGTVGVLSATVATVVLTIGVITSLGADIVNRGTNKIINSKKV